MGVSRAMLFVGFDVVVAVAVTRKTVISVAVTFDTATRVVANDILR